MLGVVYQPYTQKFGGYTLQRYLYDQQVKQQKAAEALRLATLAKKNDLIAKEQTYQSCL